MRSSMLTETNNTQEENSDYENNGYSRTVSEGAHSPKVAILSKYYVVDIGKKLPLCFDTYQLATQIRNSAYNFVDCLEDDHIQIIFTDRMVPIGEYPDCKNIVVTCDKEYSSMSKAADSICKKRFDHGLNSFDYLYNFTNRSLDDIIKCALAEDFDAYINEYWGFIGYVADRATEPHYSATQDLEEDEETFDSVVKELERLELIGNYRFRFPSSGTIPEQKG